MEELENFPNEELKEVIVAPVENSNDNQVNNTGNIEEVEEKEEVKENEFVTHTTIITPTGELNFYQEIYKEVKITNFLLQTALILTVSLYIVNKIYKLAKMLFKTNIY